MAGRLLLGIIAALRAVLIPGQAELMASQPLIWPGAEVLAPLAPAPGDSRDVLLEAPAA